MDQTPAITERQTGRSENCSVFLFPAISALSWVILLSQIKVLMPLLESKKAQISLTLLEECRDLSGISCLYFSELLFRNKITPQS